MDLRGTSEVHQLETLHFWEMIQKSGLSCAKSARCVKFHFRTRRVVRVLKEADRLQAVFKAEASV